MRPQQLEPLISWFTLTTAEAVGHLQSYSQDVSPYSDIEPKAVLKTEQRHEFLVSAVKEFSVTFRSVCQATCSGIVKTARRPGCLAPHIMLYPQLQPMVIYEDRACSASATWGSRDAAFRESCLGSLSCHSGRGGQHWPHSPAGVHTPYVHTPVMSACQGELTLTATKLAH